MCLKGNNVGDKGGGDVIKNKEEGMSQLFVWVQRKEVISKKM